MEIRDEKLRKIAEFLKGTDEAKDIYGNVLKDLFRQRYSQDKVEAINNNHLDDEEDGVVNEKHIKERNDMKAYRKACKNYAKQLLGLEE